MEIPKIILDINKEQSIMITKALAESGILPVLKVDFTPILSELSKKGLLIDSDILKALAESSITASPVHDIMLRFRLDNEPAVLNDFRLGISRDLADHESKKHPYKILEI